MNEKIVKHSKEGFEELKKTFPNEEQATLLANMLTDVIHKTTSHKMIMLVVEGGEEIVVSGQITSAGTSRLLGMLINSQMRAGLTFSEIIHNAIGPEGIFKILIE